MTSLANLMTSAPLILQCLDEKKHLQPAVMVYLKQRVKHGGIYNHLTDICVCVAMHIFVELHCVYVCQVLPS